ncbi:MAG: Ig-like domain-containing protein [Bacteroidales bacterium]|nr:Ig-like domain-containing protein [Bacteroidales bacterium]
MKQLIFYIAALIFIISGCAQIGSLTGGEKDTEPPVMLKSKPAEKALNVKENKLTFTFDEFFGLNNLNAVFLSSPPLIEKPTFKIKRKNLVVILNEKLKDTTTYMFWFADAIEDYHEKNPLKGFKFIFSTGNVLDTMEISGSLKDAFTLQPDPDMLVMIYREYNDSTPINEIPYYITKSDTSGNFKIDYIKPGKYRIFALKDLDANMKFSLPNEKIAYTDTFIIPEVKTETKTDTFKTGSVLHIGSETSAGDTLLNDTVIISEEYIYSPQNITLFTFTEDNNKQYILNSERELKGKCKFEFNKPADNVKISSLNFDLIDKNYFAEKADSGRSLIYWLRNKEIYNKDTLQFSVSYFNLDSAENKVAETDTISFTFNIDADTIAREINFEEFKTEQDSFSHYSIVSTTPIKSIDTSKIKLFEVLDTLVADTKEQKLLKFFRPAPNELVFSLKRPFAKNFFIEALNFDTTENWVQNNYRKNNTVLNCKITDKNISEKDTLKIVLHYDNAFFKNQILKFNDTLSLPLLKQGLISVQRLSADTIRMKFKKAVSSDTEIKQFVTENKNWYKQVKSEESNLLTLLIKEKELIYKDTILLTLRTNDFDNTSGEKIDFEYSKNAIFKFNKQKIKKFVREERDKFYIVFNKPLHSDININSVNFTINNEWYNQEKTSSGDTVKFKITDKFVSSLDTLKISVNYKLLNRYDKTVEEKDTLTLTYKRKRRSRKNRSANVSTGTENSEKLKTVSINIPVKYKILKDTLSERKYNLLYPWEGSKNYLLKMDSSSFTDIYGGLSKKEEIKFKVRKNDAYSKLNIKLANIGKLENPNYITSDDSTSTDSVLLSQLKKGQIILYLSNEKKEIVKTEFANSNENISYSNLIPGTYSAKIIYDINNNKKWDSGKYLKNRQPERVIIYEETITLTAGEETEIIWDL